MALGGPKSVIKNRGTRSMFSFGAYLAGLRERACLTQREAAERVGVTNAYICLVENNQRQIPRPLLIVRFAKAYSVSPTDLLQGAGYFDAMLEPRLRRLWEREREEVLRDPVVAAEADKLRARQVEVLRAFWDSFQRDATLWGKDRDKRTTAMLTELAREDRQFREILQDPVVVLIPSQRPELEKVTGAARSVILRLYEHYRFERRWRESLEKQHTGEVSDAYAPYREIAKREAAAPTTQPAQPERTRRQRGGSSPRRHGPTGK